MENVRDKFRKRKGQFEESDKKKSKYNNNNNQQPVYVQPQLQQQPQKQVMFQQPVVQQQFSYNRQGQQLGPVQCYGSGMLGDKNLNATTRTVGK